MHDKMNNRSQSGYVLIVTLIILALGTLLITPLASFITTEIKASNTTEQLTETFYAADSGMEYAIHFIINNADSLPDENTEPLVMLLNMPINGASVEITIMYVAENIYNIVVEAYKYQQKEYSTQISSYINIESGAGGIFQDVITTIGGGITSGSNTVITGNVFSNGNFSLTGSSILTGNIYAESNIQLGPSSSIVGDAYALGTIQRPQNITGSVNPGAENRDPAVIEESLLNEMVADVKQSADFIPEAAGVITRPGNWELKYWPVPDPVYPNAEHISGNMTIATGYSITFSESIHVDGDLTINCSDGIITFDGPVVVQGDINIRNGSVVFNDSVYSGDSTSVRSSSIADFYGDVKVETNFSLGLKDAVDFGGSIYVGENFLAEGNYIINIVDDIYTGGNFILKSGATLTGGTTVAVMGNMTFAASAKLDIAEIPFFIVPTGSLTFPTSDYVSAAIYAPSANAAISGNVTLYGVILCNSLSVGGSSQVEYAEGILDNPNIAVYIGGTSEGDFTILSWNID